jgi:hypothetical protein
LNLYHKNNQIEQESLDTGLVYTQKNSPAAISALNDEMTLIADDTTTQLPSQLPPISVAATANVPAFQSA